MDKFITHNTETNGVHKLPSQHRQQFNTYSVYTTYRPFQYTNWHHNI